MKILTIIVGVLVTLSGMYCLSIPGAAFLNLSWLAGLSLAVSGANAIAVYAAGRKDKSAVVWDLWGGVLSVLVGALMICNLYAQLLTDIALIYMFAGWLILSGILRIAASIKLKALGFSWAWILIFGALTVLLGIYSSLHPLFAAITLGYLIGFWIISAGLNLTALGVTILDARPHIPPSGETLRRNDIHKWGDRK
jgi:uncharacterized membrane protein HdeD (DUF308 family)